MNTALQLDIALDESIEAKRETIKRSLDKIAADIGAGLRDVNLYYPVYICIPGSGNAVASMMTPDDPSDSDWGRIESIVREIISEYLDGMGLRSTELPCTMVNAPMSAAAISAD
jgi:hypothetical protein